MLVSRRTRTERVAGQVPGFAGASVKPAISHSALTSKRSPPSTTTHFFGSVSAMAGAPAASSSAAILALRVRMSDRYWIRGTPSIDRVPALCAEQARGTQERQEKCERDPGRPAVPEASGAQWVEAVWQRLFARVRLLALTGQQCGRRGRVTAAGRLEVGQHQLQVESLIPNAKVIVQDRKGHDHQRRRQRSAE